MCALRILHLSGSKHHWSGNEQQLTDLISNLPKSETENFIFCYQGSAIERYGREHGLVCFGQKRRSIYSPLLAYQLKRCVKKNRIDVLHVHTSNFLTVFMLADILFRLHIPTVFSRKGFSEKSTSISKLKYNYKGISAITCDSKAIKTDLRKLLNDQNYHHKIHVIYDGISTSSDTVYRTKEDFCRILHIDPARYLIGNIANHVDAKDLPTLIEAMKILVHELQIKNVHLVQIGVKTDLTPALEELVHNYGLESYITFTGGMNNAKQYITAFDTVMMSSKSEGLSLVIYESFLNRVPVITTSAGGIGEVVHNEETGLISPVGDARPLAEHVVRLMGDETLKHQIIEKAHSLFMNELTAAKSAENTLNLYRTVPGK